ncbi:MAG: nucleoside hydrolase [Ruminococcaceae bacterium]|nr:nucleoside hydrolase [Oscillospiraceae bacterium]
MDKTKVILDVDTGSDDAVAIISAVLSKNIEVLGIATVNGNRCVEYTTENTLRVVEMLGVAETVPVVRGCAYPLVATIKGKKPGIPRGHYYQHDDEYKTRGKSIHGDFLEMFSPSTIKEANLNAVSWYIKTLMAAEDKSITLVPVGPLTNLAHVFQIEPRTVKKVKEIIYMGGGHLLGNTRPAAEYNVWVDPEAAQIVLESGVNNFIWVPLNATHAAYLTKSDAERIRSIGTRPAEVVAELIEQRIIGYSNYQKVEVPDAAPIHDALCIAAIHDPSVLTDIHHCYTEVDCGGSSCDGETIFDINPGSFEYDKNTPNSYVALGADREKFVNILIGILEGAK